ncbi:hypothetical protein C5Y96_26785 [Blastopirellula marina]|uniref:Uncharacterized protein n=2 Tax=Pirellulales TaxID=2691354 RepID=A0A2S8EYW4_9BACT|nr:hypothetical protein C5Y96_26785 [Blastopirellula marina]RCS40961.1 hypothetical protein DTL36_26830 [Bremerella cremea]
MFKCLILFQIVAILELASNATAGETLIGLPMNQLSGPNKIEAVVDSLVMSKKETEYFIESFTLSSEFKNKRWIGAAFLKSYETNSDVELIGLLIYENGNGSKNPPARLLLSQDHLLVKAPGKATKELQLGSMIFANTKGETRVIETDLRLKCNREELREASKNFFDRLVRELSSEKSDKTSD